MLERERSRTEAVFFAKGEVILERATLQQEAKLDLFVSPNSVGTGNEKYQ